MNVIIESKCPKCATVVHRHDLSIPYVVIERLMELAHLERRIGFGVGVAVGAGVVGCLWALFGTVQ